MAIRIDGKDYPADSAQVAVDALESKLSGARADADDGKGKLDAMQAKYDALKAKYDELKGKLDAIGQKGEEKEDRADSAESRLAWFNERLRVLEVAKREGITSERCDALDNSALRREVVCKHRADAKDASDEYVNGAFEVFASRAPSVDAAGKVYGSPAPRADGESRTDAHDEYMERLRNPAKAGA